MRPKIEAKNDAKKGVKKITKFKQKTKKQLY